MKYLSVYEKDEDLLKAFSDVFLKGKWYDLDCTYSKGVFYKNLPSPKMKSDLVPLQDDVLQADSTELKFVEDNSLNSIIFDPPFLFRNRKSSNNDKMCSRFSYFTSFDDLIEMYHKSLDCFHRKLKKGGYIFFKCQDMTDNSFYCTHNEVINYAKSNGFKLKDIGIKISKSKLQREARQQNCLAKTHCYWIVLKK